MAHVIFDLDGTLIESEQIWRDVRAHYVTEHGGRWREEAQQTMMGMRTSEWAQYIHRELGVSLAPDRIADEVVHRVCEALFHTVPVLPGAQAALERLANAFPLSLATSAALPVAQAVLEKTGWRELFRAVVSADQVERGKPAPDVYLRAIELLRAEPRATAAIEDSGNGVKSAHAAHLAVVAIPNREYPPDAQTLSLAAQILPSLEMLNESVVLDAIAQVAS